MHTLKLIFDPMGLYVLAQYKTGQRSCSDTNFNYLMNGGGPLKKGNLFQYLSYNFVFYLNPHHNIVVIFS